MSRTNRNALPFAEAATIVRANQKDNYFSSTLTTQISDVVKAFKGQRFVGSHPEELAVIGKTLYFLVTTVLGARTLGEEYVDIIYVNRRGTRFPKLFSRLLFTLSYVVLPYLVTRLVRRFRSQENESKSWLSKLLTSYPSLLSTIVNIHVALFYFEGSYYSISKRFLGLRYAFGHNQDPNRISNLGNYTILGGILLFQFAIKSLIKLNQVFGPTNKGSQEETRMEDPQKAHSTFYKLEQLATLHSYVTGNEKLASRVTIDLSDPQQLPYIPEGSRNCMLCLSTMVNPSAANCGHMFCWDCIVDWIREHPECPLCRQVCFEQNLLPLR